MEDTNLKVNRKSGKSANRAGEVLADSEMCYRHIFETALEGILILDGSTGEIADVNPSLQNMLGFPYEEILGKKPWEISSFKNILASQDAFLEFQKKEHSRTGNILLEDRAGRTMTVEFDSNVYQVGNKQVIQWNFRDFTESKQAENTLRQSGQQLRSPLDTILEGCQIIGFDWHYLYINDAAARHGRQAKETLLGHTMMDVYPGIENSEIFVALKRCMEERSPSRMENQFVYPDNSKAWFEISVQPVPEGISLLSIDITAHKKAEEELRLAETKYRNLIEQLPAAIYIDAINENSSSLFFSPQIEAITGYSPSEWENDPDLWVKLLHPDDRERVLAENAHTNQSGEPFQTEYRMVSRGGQTVWVRDEAVLMHDPAGQPNFWQGMLLDITERKNSEELIQHQIKRLAALRTIDTAIASSTDLPLTLDIALEQAVTLLGVDAADVLLLNPHTLILNYAAGTGFRTNTLQHTHLHLGEGYAGMAGLERKTISITGLSSHKTDLLRSPTFKSEDFDIYICTPLITKGELKGVLEIFHRTPMAPSPDWLEFLETIAGQVAIAIDSALMFTGLQQANVDLTMAYDNTIEGWSKALELRDKKTEGHTQRVTRMALNLASALGMEEKDLVHVRRGALLHDIGKMGIPNSILLKPGPLTDEEWATMHKHPVFANDLLSSIPYLHPALIIPYCHHEKWDGTGYPRGLKGEEIPLAARLFAVVDVWDALCTDRPYRKAWSPETVLAYIKSLAGTHFDPKVVELFINLLGQSKQGA